MWQDRLKGLVVIFLFALLIGGLVRFVSSRQEELSQNKIDFSPAVLEEKVLGVVSQIKRRVSGEPLPQDVSDPGQIVEEKATELIDSLKKLPQEQAEAVKNRLLRQICEEVLSEATSTENQN